MWTFANCAFLVICLSWCCNQCETTFMIKAWFLFWMKNLFSDAGDRTMSGTSKASLWPLQHSATQNNLFKMGQPRPLFRLFLVLSNNQYNFYNNQCEKMFIQYTAPGFEPTTSQTWIVTHNHLSRAPAHPKTIFVGALIEWLLLETRNVEIVCSNLNQMNYFSQYVVKLFCCLKRLRPRMSHLRKNAF